MGEIERGIVKVQQTDAAFAVGLTIWLEDTMLLYSDHILPVTAPIARRWGRLSVELGYDGADLFARRHGIGAWLDGGHAQRSAFQAMRGESRQSICGRFLTR